MVGSVNRDAVVWGLVGGLSFLVLVTGYELATGWRVSWSVKLGVAVLVAVLATIASTLVERRLRGLRRENERA